MKRFIYIILCCVVAGLVGFSYKYYHNETQCLCAASSLPLAEIRSGDLLFSEGHSFKSDLVRIAARNYHSDYSHVGIIRRHRSGIHVVHMSIDSGVILEEHLNNFIQNNRSLRIGFARWQNSIDTLQLNHVLDSLLSIRKAFDYQFDMTDNSKYYCTELIVQALRLCDCPITIPMPKERILYPSALLNQSLIILNN